jgi:hypothetical protein
MRAWSTASAPATKRRAAPGVARAARECADVGAGHHHAAGARRQQPGNQRQQRALAGARRTAQQHLRALRGFEVRKTKRQR